MCLEGTGGWSGRRLGHEDGQAHRLESSAIGEQSQSTAAFVLGCSGCADKGYCRRGLDSEQALSSCNENDAQLEHS